MNPNAPSDNFWHGKDEDICFRKRTARYRVMVPIIASSIGKERHW